MSSGATGSTGPAGSPESQGSNGLSLELLRPVTGHAGAKGI